MQTVGTLRNNSSARVRNIMLSPTVVLPLFAKGFSKSWQHFGDRVHYAFSNETDLIDLEPGQSTDVTVDSKYDSFALSVSADGRTKKIEVIPPKDWR